MLNIRRSEENGAAAFALEGRLDTVTAVELEKAIQQTLPGVKAVTLDFEKLDYISSAGLRVLLSAQKQMNAKGGEMKLRRVNETILEIFAVTGFSDILTIEP
jgi:anti-sigma B factor antagonist